MIQAWQINLLNTKNVEEFLYKDDTVEVSITIRLINDNYYIWETVRAKTFSFGCNKMWTPLDTFKDIIQSRVLNTIDVLLSEKLRKSANELLWKMQKEMTL